VRHSLPTIEIIDSPVTALPFAKQLEAISIWARERVSHFVCVANTHMLIEAHWNPDFDRVLRAADLITPDGMPLVWMMKLLGEHQQNRVAGMDIFLALCHEASIQGIGVFFVGSQKDVLEKIRRRLNIEFPNLDIAGMEPLPFRPLTIDEDVVLTRQINESGAGLVFVSLGCPKQEYWMASHKGRIQAVMLGLGGIFPIYAGIQKRAPHWAREAGLEWLYRLFQEPRRLWKRYGTTIPIFIWLALKQLSKNLPAKRNTVLAAKSSRLIP
jgi:N-acetylglucosaminyldiphosphoundecaprenol N-acetyl-beta-D-mannosaminyltransferase